MAKRKQKAQEKQIKEQLGIETRRGPQWTGLAPKIEESNKQKNRQRERIKNDTKRQVNEYMSNRREGYTKLRQSSQSNEMEY